MSVGERFDFLDPIGRGSMGHVWRAFDRRTGAVVAVKLLNSALVGEPSYVLRLEREIEVARRLVSPNIVRVLGYGRRDGVPFIVMDYIQGPSLREVLDQRRALPWPEARSIALQVAKALRVAHAAGVIHRDVKPSNILIEPDGRTKLVDFGVARAVDMTRLTGTDMMLGTPLYMAPELEPSPRVDFYALGCVLFEMLVGETPFRAGNSAQLLLEHMRTRPDLRRVPPEARRVLEALLQKNPQRRPIDAEAVIAMLGEESRPARLQQAALPRRVLVAGGAGFAAVAGILGSVLAVAASSDDGPGLRPIATLAPETPTRTTPTVTTPTPTATTSPTPTPPAPPPPSAAPVIVKQDSRPRVAWGEKQPIEVIFSVPDGDAKWVQLHASGANDDGSPLQWNGFTAADGSKVEWTGDGYIRRPAPGPGAEQRGGTARYSVVGSPGTELEFAL